MVFRNLALVRADVSRLPFASGSVDAIHAGAALHCWPSASNAVSDLSSFHFLMGDSGFWIF
jgi:ubiquinone/menaquinone biosynthesis C-methylase UbiE